MCRQAEAAKDYYMQGFNCAQAVCAAFAEEAGLNPSVFMRLATPFGGGIADRKGVCGAVTGMLMAAGLLNGRDYVPMPEEKAEYIARMNRLIDRFTVEYGHTGCRELLDLRDESVDKREYCAGLVHGAAKILQSDTE